MLWRGGGVATPQPPPPRSAPASLLSIGVSNEIIPKLEPYFGLQRNGVHIIAIAIDEVGIILNTEFTKKH